MAASAVCRVAGAGTRVLLRTRRSVRWQQAAGLWGAELRDVDREWAVSGGGSRLGRSRGQGRGKVTARNGDGGLAAGLGAGTGIPLRACELRGNTPTQSSVPIARLQQPALLKSPALRSTATFAQALQSVPETQVSQLDNGLRVASEQSSQPTCTVSGAAVGRAPPYWPGVFPGRGVTLGSRPLWFGSPLD